MILKELSQYAYFKSKTLESILQKIYLSNTEHDVTTSKIPFYHFSLVNVCLNIFLKTFFMNARPIPEQSKVHLKKLQLLAVTYDMGF